MANLKLSDEELADRTLGVFRDLGYEGASLSRLAKATGLEKASLYYRYPGGKKDIAMGVAARVSAWFEANVLGPLAADCRPADRVRVVAGKLRAFYGDGKRPCILDTLSLESAPEELRTALAQALVGWIGGFTKIARESGFPAREAARRAEQAVINVEGSLVLSRVSGDPQVFLRSLAGLKTLLTKP